LIPTSTTMRFGIEVVLLLFTSTTALLLFEVPSVGASKEYDHDVKTVAAAKQRLLDSLSQDRWEEMGALHNTAFHELSKMYSDKRKKPASKMEMMNDIHDVIASFCGDNDSACHSKVEDSASRREDNAYFPDDFNPKLLESMDSMYVTLYQLASSRKDESSYTDRRNVNEEVQNILDKLTDIQSDIKKNFMDVDEFGVSTYTNIANDYDEVNPLHLMAALSGISVAIESTKLWTAVYADKNHPLHGLHHPTYYEASNNSNEDADNVRGRRAQQVAVPDNNTKIFDEDYDYDYDYGSPPSLPDLPDLPDLGFLDFLADRFNIVDIIQADIDGAIFGLLEEASDDPIIVLQPQNWFITSFASAVVESASWALNPPSPTPSSAPSSAPSVSVSPSVSPSNGPTVTMIPSAALSASPSAALSASPSAAPSASPSAAPSASPSAEPP